VTSWAKPLQSNAGTGTNSPMKGERRRLFSFQFSSRPKVPHTPGPSATDRPPDFIHWPSELLPQTVNDVRILTYGYDSKVVRLFQTASNNGIVQHAGNLLAALVRIREGLVVAFPSSCSRIVLTWYPGLEYTSYYFLSS